MKRFLTTFLVLLLVVLLLAGGGLAWSYYSASEDDVPAPVVTAAGQTLPRGGYQWTVPVFGGLFSRELAHIDSESKPPDLGTLEDPVVPIAVPDGWHGSVEVWAEPPSDEADIQFEGTLAEYAEFTLPENGTYQWLVRVLPDESADANHVLTYSFRATLDVPPPPPPEPEIVTSAASISQGDVFAVEVRNAPEGVVPTAQTELGMAVFAQTGADWIAYIPASHQQQPGDYPLTVQCGELTEELTITVTEGDFERQDLWIDLSNPVTSEAASDKAYAQFRSTIHPFYQTADPVIYWDGTFLRPVEGRVSTQYGLRRYTNGAATPSRHSGVDLAVAEGTPIQCPAAGRVVFSDYLLNTGNTLVIEHGGGLKTYYYHLLERQVETGDRVEQGQLLGKVGTTGYSTGSHLHFEVRIGASTVNPWNLIEGKGGFFGLPEPEADGNQPPA